MRSSHLIPLLLLLGAIPAMSCSDPYEIEIPQPSLGSLRVETQTAGLDHDPDGYLVEFVGVNRQASRVSVNGEIVIHSLRPGRYMIRLADVAANCSAIGPLVVTVVAGDTIPVIFSATCTELGLIGVSINVTGVDPDPNGFKLSVRGPGTWRQDHVSAGSQTLKVPAGIHVVALADVAANCDLDSSLPQSLQVEPGDTTTVTFDVSCSPVTRLAYVSAAERAIYAVNSNGTAAVRLTGSSFQDEDPAWSPDGTRIAFTSRRDGNAEIYVMSQDGSNVTRLTNSAGDDAQPGWSPDGEAIVFVSMRDGNAELYRINADGSNPVRLTNHFASDIHPAWSPDGRTIAFTSDRGGNRDIWVTTVDDGAVVPLVASPQPEAHPTWSPAGDMLAFERQCNPEPCSPEIRTVHANGWQEKIVGIGGEPAWSPDGGKLAYSAVECTYDFYYYYVLECHNAGIRIIGRDGSGEVELIGVRAFQPAWRR